MWIDDDILMRSDESLALDVFVPTETVVVCGAANDEKTEARLANCATRGIPVLKRYGGGGTVVLYPGVVIVSLGGWVKKHFHNGFYFGLINEALIRSLTSRWSALTLTQNGISDIVHGEKKIVGTSLFRSRNYLLYQASILVDLDIELIEDVLAYPSRTPDYRQGRSHRDFLIGLSELDGTMSPSVVAEHLGKTLADTLVATLGVELIQPIADQITHVKKRAERGRSS